MASAAHGLPDDVQALKRLVLAREAELAQAKAREASAEAVILNLRLAVEKLRRELYGQRSERGSRLLNQMELELEELEATTSEDELAAERAAAQRGAMAPASRRKGPARRPLPDHLPRERVLVPGPTSCACCGSARLAKLGEDVTETLEMVPRSWKVIQHVREKFTCRACEAISQAPAPFHVLPRGFAGPNLLATVLFESRRPAKRITGSTSPSTGRPSATPARACRSASPRWPIRSAAARLSCGRFTSGSAPTC